MSESTFISEHKHFCECGYDERMSEYIVKQPPTWQEDLIRECKGCGRRFKVARWGR